jgi:hypothetical protein
LKNELADDAALLERALREGWARERAELRALLARRPDWSALLDGPEAVPVPDAAALEQDRRLVNESLALARAASRAGARSRRVQPWMLAAAVALLFAGGVTLWRANSGTAIEDSQLLGSNRGHGSQAQRRVACRTPDHDASAYETLDWDASEPLGEGEWYEVLVQTCAGAGERPTELAREPIRPSSLVTGDSLTRWSPSAELHAQWPDCIQWSVRLMDASDQVLDSDSVRVERSPR